MIALEKRLKHLESVTGTGDKCPECGFAPSETPPWSVHIMRHDEPTELDRWCGECGCKLVHNVKLRWD